MKAKAEKIVKEILVISDEYEQALFIYRERGGDRPKGMEYFKREVAVLEQYINEVSRERSITFSSWVNTVRMTDGSWDKSDAELYNDWIKEQEEQL